MGNGKEILLKDKETKGVFIEFIARLLPRSVNVISRSPADCWHFDPLRKSPKNGGTQATSVIAIVFASETRWWRHAFCERFKGQRSESHKLDTNYPGYVYEPRQICIFTNIKIKILLNVLNRKWSLTYLISFKRKLEDKSVRELNEYRVEAE